MRNILAVTIAGFAILLAAAPAQAQTKIYLNNGSNTTSATGNKSGGAAPFNLKGMLTADQAQQGTNMKYQKVTPQPYRLGGTAATGKKTPAQREQRLKDLAQQTNQNNFDRALQLSNERRERLQAMMGSREGFGESVAAQQKALQDKSKSNGLSYQDEPAPKKAKPLVYKKPDSSSYVPKKVFLDVQQ